MESLEDRRLLAAHLVDTVVDESDGDFSAGDLSLREAIELSNANPGPDTIAFDAQLTGETITLTLGQLQITDDLTITGLGADQLTIDGDNSSRIFSIWDASVGISKLSLVYGQATGALEGGAIRNVYGDLTVDDSTLAYNSADSRGGAIMNYEGSTTVTDSTLAYNSTVDGGAIYSVRGTLIVTNSTLAANDATSNGGGILTSGTATVTNSTVAYNSASYGGGIFNYVDSTLEVTNSVVGGNTASLYAPDVRNYSGTIDSSHNVIQDGTGSDIFNGVDSNQVGVDPLLDPAGLQDNGGPTQTIALMPNSPAINNGNNALAVDADGNPLEFDQRGSGYPRVVAGAVDIGAFELQQVPPVPPPDETLGGLIDYILATFHGVPPVNELMFQSGDPIPGTAETIPDAVQVGQVPAALGDSSDLQLDNLTLTFPTTLDYDSSTSTWSGGVGVAAIQGTVLPGLLDVGIVDDALDNPRRIKTATVLGQQSDGKYQVVFTLPGDHRDLGDNVLFPTNEIAVLNSSPATFNAEQVFFTDVSFDEGGGETHVTVEYGFDPGNSWTGGGLLAALDPDIDDDGDMFGVSGTIQLAPGNADSVLKFNALEAADIGFPRWLDIRIAGLQMEFADFRTDDADNKLRLNGSLRGFETGNYLVNEAIRNNPLLKLNVTGTLSGIEFDMDKLAEGTVDYGVVTLPKNPITDLSGISGEVSGSIFGVGSVQAGFIVKEISVDANGAITTQESDIAETALYGAVRGSLGIGPQFSAGFNFAISELGPLQFFVFSNVNIPLEPISGLAITELRGGVRLNSNIEDLQVRPPIGTTAGTVTEFVDQSGTDTDFRITLTTAGHNLKVGDEFRIINAGNSDYNSGVDNFVVTAVNGDDITYVVEENPGAFTTADIRKMTISDPLDLRDPGFASTKDLSLSGWETQLDQAVVNQMNVGGDVWDVLFDKAVIEAGATLSFDPRIPDELLRLDVDLLFDTELRFLATGSMNLFLDQVSIPAKLYADFSEATEGATTFLFLADLPEVPQNPSGVKPLLVTRAGVTFETLVGGVPATLDALTGLPSGVGIDVLGATVTDLSGTGIGPWDVTYTLNLPSAVPSATFAVGDSVTIVNSDPETFNGTHIVRSIDDVQDTITVRIGTEVIDGRLDIDLDGNVGSEDDGYFNGIPVIDGALDTDRDGAIGDSDDGEVFTVIAGVVVGYAVTDGKIDVDGDGDISSDPDDDGVLGEDPGTMTTAGMAANLDDLGDGFRISVEGGIDLNIPFVTTVTLEGSAQLDFMVGTGDTDARIDLAFDAALSESNVGTIAQASGAFHVTIDSNLVDAGGDSGLMLPEVQVWGAAILDTDLGFLEPIGLFVDAEGLLRINSSNEAKPDEILTVGNHPVPVALPAESFALRLDGGVDFRIDFNGDDTFAESESAFQVGGIFVLEFSAEQGFNVAIFDENNDQVVPANLTLGPKSSPFVAFDVLGFLAIRSHGMAANLVLSANTSLPLGLASIDATAAFIVNTTGVDVVFEIPGVQTNPEDPPEVLSLTIPGAAPANPSAILNHSQADADLDALKTGSPTWEEASAGPYGVVFLAGGLEVLSVLDLDVSGYVLLSEEVVSLEANFSAAGNFFNLASASAHGTLFFSSQGEFVIDVGGNVQLGPDGFNISGSANLEVSHLDSDGRGSNGDGNFVLDIQGSLAVAAEIFYIDIGSVSVDVAYNSGSGVITVGIDYPEPYWAKSCTRVWLVGTVCVYYPSFRTASYTFEVGKLTVEPPVLGQVDASGVLTLNVGPQANARNLAVSEVNEDVVIDDVSAGSQRGRKISVTMFGLTQTFDNVARIWIPDMGDGNDFVDIQAGVQTEVEVHLGDGDDRLANAGSAAVIAYGDEGNDQLNGGDASEQMSGGPGDDVIAGGGGPDVMVGGPGADELILETNHLHSSHFDGGADEDKITIVGDSSPHDLRVTTDGSYAGTISSYSDNVETGSVTFANMEDVMLSGGFNQEDFALLRDGNVVASGTVGDDEITVASGSAIVTINDDTLTFSGPDVERVLVGSLDGDDTIQIVDGENMTILGGPGNDTIVMNSTLPGGVTADGEEGSDQFLVYLGNLAGEVAIADSGVGTSDVDVVTVVGTAADETISIRQGAVQVGSQVISISSTAGELLIDGGAGSNKVVVEGVLTTPVVWENAFGTGVTAGTLLITGTAGKDIVDVELVDPKGSDNDQEGGSGTPQIKVISRLDVGGNSDGGGDDGTDISYHDPNSVERIRIVLGEGDDQARVGGESDEDCDEGAVLTIPATLEGGPGKDKLHGGQGNDSLYGGPGKDMLWGHCGHDHLDGGDDDDDLKGGPGNDVLVGGTGSDKLKGGWGRDLLIGGSGADDLKADSDGGSDVGVDVPGEILIAGLTIFDGDATTLRHLLNVEWIARIEAGHDYSDVVDDLTTGQGQLVPGMCVFDDQSGDKLKGSESARDLFFADIDNEDDDDDKIKGRNNDELVVDLAELLAL